MEKERKKETGEEEGDGERERKREIAVKIGSLGCSFSFKPSGQMTG